MPITVHPDLRGHYLGAYFIAVKGDLWGVYDHISRLPRTDPVVQVYHDDFLVYQPLTYAVHAVWMKMAAPIINFDLYELFAVDPGRAMLQKGFGGLVFALKLPYLLADLVCLWLLLKIVEPKHKALAGMLWAFNLPVLHSAFMMGQFDIFLVLFIVLALYQIKLGKPVMAAVCLAVASGFKPFPVFLIPFLPGNFRKNLAVGLAVYLLIVAPYLLSPGYRMYALVAEHADKMWFARLMVSGSQYLPVFMVGLAVLWWFKYFLRKSLPDWAWLMSPLLLFYSVTHYHPQWFSWLSPFLILGAIKLEKARPMIVVMLVSYLVILFSFESSLNFGLFGLSVYLAEIINRFYPADQLVSLVRGVFAATGIAFLVYASRFSRNSSL